MPVFCGLIVIYMLTVSLEHLRYLMQLLKGMKCVDESLRCLRRWWECNQCISVQYEPSECQCMIIVDVHSNNCVIKNTLMCVTLSEDVLFKEAGKHFRSSWIQIFSLKHSCLSTTWKTLTLLNNSGDFVMAWILFY